MKNLFLVAVLFLTAFTASAQQIGDCSQEGTRIKIYDPSGRSLSTLYVSSSETLAGFSSTILAIVDGTRVKVYGPNAQIKTTFYISSGEWVKNVAGNNILVADGRRIRTYDSTGHLLNTRYE